MSSSSVSAHDRESGVVPHWVSSTYWPDLIRNVTLKEVMGEPPSLGATQVI